MQTASTCGPPARLKSQGVADADIPAWLADVYDKVPQADRGPGGHILTGPVAIAEAQPGDVLEVRILKINLDTDVGLQRLRQRPRLSAGRLSLLEIQDHPARPQEDGRQLRPRNHHPAASVLRVHRHCSAGVCRASGTPPRPGSTAATWTTRSSPSAARVFYPVFAPGALFEAGDGHAGQGNGEVDITALETFLTGTFQFIVHKGEATQQKLEWPRAETATHYIAMGFDEDLKKATEIAVRNMITFLADQNPDYPHLSRDDAYALISTACDVDITQLVDTKSGVHVMCPKALFTGPRLQDDTPDAVTTRN